MSEGPRRWRWSDSLDPLLATLDGDGVLAIPTESSYGLAVDPRRPRAVAAVFSIKSRPPDRPLPVILGEPRQLRMLGGDPASPALAEVASLWPAPLSVVVPIERPLPATAGRPSLAVRVPSHSRLRELLVRLGRPLTATSANASGQQPATRPAELMDLLEGWPSVVIDDGELPGGPPSTLVEVTSEGLCVLRAGAIPVERLRESLSLPVFSAAAAEISAEDSRQGR